jgi:hypothetical protein
MRGLVMFFQFIQRSGRPESGTDEIHDVFFAVQTPCFD